MCKERFLNGNESTLFISQFKRLTLDISLLLGCHLSLPITYMTKVLDTFTEGNIRISVLSKNEKNKFIAINKFYRDKNEWKSTNFFSPSDLHTISKLSQKADEVLWS